MKMGDLVRLYEPANRDSDFSVGNIDRNLPGWTVPPGSVAMITGITQSRGDGVMFDVVVDGKVGWVYEEDCEAIDD